MLSILANNNYLYHIILYFILYSFLGWCLEVAFFFKKKGEFVNRGFLYGPFCPIYGIGVLSLIIFLQPLIYNIPLLLLGAFVFPSLVEYIVGFLLEKLFNTTWWNYSEDKYNLKGRICLKFSIFWWILSLFILLLIHPYIIEKAVNLIPQKIGYIITYLLVTYLFIDFTITLITLLQFKGIFAELTHVSAELRSKLETARNLAEGFSTAELRNTAKTFSQKVTNKLGYTVENLSQRLNNTIESFGYKNETEEYKKQLEYFLNLQSRVEELRSTYDTLTNKLAHNYSRIFKAYPNLKLKTNSSILADIKSKIKSFNIKRK